MALMKHSASQRFTGGPAVDQVCVATIAQILAEHRLYEISTTTDRVSFTLLPLLQRPAGRRNNPLGFVVSGEIRLHREGDEARVEYDVKYHSAVIWGPLLMAFCFLGVFPAIVPDPPPMWGMFLMTVVGIGIVMGYAVGGRSCVADIVDEAVGKACEAEAHESAS